MSGIVLGSGLVRDAQDATKQARSSRSAFGNKAVGLKQSALISQIDTALGVSDHVIQYPFLKSYISYLDSGPLCHLLPNYRFRTG